MKNKQKKNNITKIKQKKKKKITWIYFALEVCTQHNEYVPLYWHVCLGFQLDF